MHTHIHTHTRCLTCGNSVLMYVCMLRTMQEFLFESDATDTTLTTEVKFCCCISHCIMIDGLFEVAQWFSSPAMWY
jgi:hypothetical protein